MPEIKLINPTTYEVTMPLGDKVEIGDKESADFKPHLKLNRWNEECAVGLGFSTIRKIAPNVQADKITWDDGKIACEFIPQPPSKGAELGGFKFNIILKKKPKTNVSVLNFKAQGLKFYYQPALTPEEIAEGCFRPENVVGSYAVYHATKQPTHANQEEAEKYRACKAFHWYRPLIWDNSTPRKEVWGELNVDTEKGIRTVTIPQDFLDNAVYPVTLDDTFGVTSIGGTTFYGSADRLRRTNAAYTGAAGIGTSMSIYGEEYNNGDAHVKLALYKDSDGTLVKGTDEITQGAEAAWNSGNFTPNPTLEAIDYWLVLLQNEAQTFYCDIGAVGYKYATRTYEDGFPADSISWSTSSYLYIFSIYCTYTPVAPPAAVMPWNLAPRMAMMMGSH
ncbi:hypothetical protein ES703_46105 [subsurface metagenome]